MEKSICWVGFKNVKKEVKKSNNSDSQLIFWITFYKIIFTNLSQAISGQSMKAWNRIVEKTV